MGQLFSRVILFAWVTALVVVGRASTAAAACSVQSPQQWQEFVTKAAQDRRWATTCERHCDASFNEFITTTILQPLNECAPQLELNPPLAKCTERLKSFAKAWLNLNSLDSYGFRSSNRQYHLAQEQADKPAGMMTPPAALLAALPLRTTVEQTAQNMGWKYLYHPSAIKGFRDFLWIPDPAGRFDQWLIVNYEFDPNRTEDVTPLSFLAVQKQDSAGRVLPRVRLHFRNYDAVARPGGYQLELEDHFSGKCYSCHPSGVRRLLAQVTPATLAAPVRGEPDFGAAASSAFAGRRLREFNGILASYGLPDWDGEVSPEQFGPLLGAAQGCTACHNGVTRGPLTIVTSEPQTLQKIGDEMAMPPDPLASALIDKWLHQPAAMSQAERQQLAAAQAAHAATAEAYRESRLPTLAAWLLERTCL